MSHEFVRAVPTWQGQEGRHDCVYFYNHSNRRPGFAGLHVAQVLTFLSFELDAQIYPCALVRWFVPMGDEPCPNTRMWKVEPLLDNNGDAVCSIEHVDNIVRAAHLIPVFGNHPLPRGFSFQHSLQAFNAYYVNKFVDLRAHEIAF
ncbi:hypothetical protein BDN72DRAFT_781831 [Pluteus cervinus]|uniref:Uncharacterized protein n=1 Tax=Pluteus cervinus TaxID=181527 RepID=A0ACD2ZZ38_9AGAR|nr:hypothetical protein BDN72DRAFT_781831 [Pluteus cervinus]